VTENERAPLLRALSPIPQNRFPTCKAFIDATREFDYPILMGVLLVTSVLVVFANLLADVAYGIVDPRIKY